MKKFVVSVTLAAATLASSSAAFADEINPDAATTDKQAQPASSTTATTSSPAPSTSVTSTTTTTSAPITTPIDRPTYELRENRRPNRPLLITGGAIFAGTYATTAALVAANDSKPDQNLYIPVVGPWLHLADRDGNEGNTSQTLLIGASGVLQGAGVAIMVASLFIPEKRSVGTISAGPVKMMIGPGGAAGTF